MLNRIIPILTIKNRELVKSIQFSKHRYIGDVINAVKIFNEFGADELMLFDITAHQKSDLDYDFLKEVTSECFIPISYGGSVNSLNKIENLLKIGIEKVCINSAINDVEFVSEAVKKFGTSTISVCIDYKNVNEIPIVYFKNGTKNSRKNILNVISAILTLNVGEIIIQSIDRDGTYSGYDLTLLEEIRKNVKNPIVIAGGCRDNNDIETAFRYGVNACAAGSLFVYYTKKKGILINYFDNDDFDKMGLER
ncbi:MAG: hypothetical protein A2W98_04905 [Bacteroidetes bacterium GWF2_33_38]|nr:MAG: hypothetical protein A2W98_04905 [Bacteroidetes bacterium GWF2_33_38]OFY88667.1 MAG: hypothetical protein A2236_06645 [Bacteroidetes bacterium RIFOXYA2_FULL_33_7]